MSAPPVAVALRCIRCKHEYHITDRPAKTYYYYIGGASSWHPEDGLCPTCFDRDGRAGQHVAEARVMRHGACLWCGGVGEHLATCSRPPEQVDYSNVGLKE